MVIIIVLGIIDFLRVAESGEAKDLKVAVQKLLKSAIVVAIVLLLPLIAESILNLIESVGTKKCI